METDIMNRHSKSKEFFLQVSFDYLSQLEAVIEAKRIGRSAVAKILGVSKGRVSQIFNRPSNLKLEKIVEYARRLNRKVAIVLYDDGDGRNKKGPILPQIFVECWKRQGSPRNFFELNRPAAPLRVIPRGPLLLLGPLIGRGTASTSATARLGITTPFPKRIPVRAVRWLEGVDTGISSETIWRTLTGETPSDTDVPCDPSDFGRCYRLLKIMPEWRPRLR